MPHLISNKPKECDQCSLEVKGEGFIQPEGIGSIPLLAVGESPGYNEIIDSLPFRPQAQAGSVLHRSLQRLRQDRNSIAITNLIQCRPPQDHLLGAYYEYSAINHCRVHFDRIINKYNPRVILALGGLPYKHLTGMEGYKLNISTVRGYVFRCSRYSNILVIPTYHPSYVMRGNIHLQGVLMNDIMRAIWLAQGKLKEDVDYCLDPIDKYNKYNIKPTQEDALGFLQKVKENPSLLVAYDIETDKTAGEEEDEIDDYGQKITQIQFSTDCDSGIAFPFVEPFIGIARQILRTSNPKCGHNILDFDNCYLYKSGFEINGRLDDTMWMQHFYQADLSIGLQYSASFYGMPYPWKHLSGSEFEFYGISDVVACQYIMRELPGKMQQRVMWDGYEKYCREFKPILERISVRGLGINIEKQDKFGVEVEKRQEEVLEELKVYVPDSLEKFNKKDGYVKEPKEVLQARLDYYLSKGTTNCEVPDSFIKETTGFVRREFEVVEKKRKSKKGVDISKLQLPGVVFKDIPKEVEEEGIKIKVDRWVRLVEFNPNSPDQVSDYIKNLGHAELAEKYKIQLKKDIEKENKKDNVSTAKNVLKKLADKTGNKGYKLIVEYKELSKMKGTYIEGYRKCLKEDNRVHTLYTMRPASGQLSSREPNVQNYPVHSDLAEPFKECIEAKEGHVFVCFDYRGFHNKMMGFLAKDEVYLRIASLDTHSFVTGHVVGYPQIENCLELNDNELAIYLSSIKKKYKKLRDDQIKHVVHGINFGLSEKGCYERYLEEFNPTAEEILSKRKKQPSAEQLVKLIEKEGREKVKRVYKIVRGLFPKVFEWQDQTIVDADKLGFIQNVFGARRWFMAATVIKYDKFGNKMDVKKGMQAEEALAFPVSSSSHYHMRESMIILEEKGLNEKYNLVNMIHDSLIDEVKVDLMSECISNVREVMEHKSSKLKNSIMPDGFFCEVDIKIGKNMRELEEYNG